MLWDTSHVWHAVALALDAVADIRVLQTLEEHALASLCSLLPSGAPAMTATTLTSFIGVTRSPSTRALVMSVHMLALLLRIVLLVTLVLASDNVNRN